MIRISTLLLVCLCVMSFPGCASKKHIFDGDAESQAQLRSIQSRPIDAKDKIELMHAVMATLQDLGFVIDDANDMIGTVTATRMDKYALTMTVSVRKRGLDGGQFIVRANLQYKMKPVVKPKPYIDFFATLSKSQFLTIHEAE